MLDKYFIFDFDDTLWSRDSSLEDISIENLFLLHRFSETNNVVIISGNSIDHIKECFLKAKLVPNYDIWANASGSLFVQFNKIKTLEKFKLPFININGLRSVLPYDTNIKVEDTFIKLKPINSLVRDLVCQQINNTLNDSRVIAKMTGRTTIDILTRENSKAEVINEYKNNYLIFFGDEIVDGNDTDAAKMCDEVFACSSVLDTNKRLKKLCCMV